MRRCYISLVNESKTDEAEKPECTCDWLHRAADDPKIPVTFSPELNEFHLIQTGGYLFFHFCPFCGGRAPKSLRKTFFAHIPPEEETRLYDLCRDFKTLDDVTAAWGLPDRDRHTLTYRSLSTTADVVAHVDNGEWRGIFLHRKSIKNEPNRNA